MHDALHHDDAHRAGRRLLPLVGPRRAHGRSEIGCRYKCNDACSRPAPNPTDHLTFREVAGAALSRRRVLHAGLVAGLAGVAAAACGGGGGGNGATPAAGAAVAPALPSTLGFTAVPPNTQDAVVVPEGFEQQVVIRWGDPVLPGAPAFDPARQTAAAQAQQFGFNNDYLTLIDVPGRPGRALLVANHEYSTEPQMLPGYNPDTPTPEHVGIGMAAHGMSVVMVERDPASGRLTVVMDPLNRRITATTPMTLTGPAAGDPLLRTTADPEGRTVLGTLNNCSGGTTPWNTVLSGEENVDQYFGNGEAVADPVAKAKLARYGMDGGASQRKWETVDPRFDLLREPNEPHRFGWIVELDPFDPGSAPRKRTALGRMKHEGANVRIGPTGTVAVYMGDDERFEYMYKFVSSRTHRAGTAPADRECNARLLDEGTLFVARFTGNPAGAPGQGAEGSGEWLPLVESRADGTGQSFVSGMSAADVLVHTRQAADVVGATKMDRPEDVQPHPTTGRVYAALTNNDERGTPGKPGVDAVNPRPQNTNGQVLELVDAGDDPGARTFGWSLLLVCGDPAAADTYFGGFPKDQVSPISCPDNVAFDTAGNLWVATDGNELGSNDGLFAVPLDGPQRGRVQQFLTVPKGAETCGPVLEERLALVAVQHPGESDEATFENPASRWPDGGTAPPRPAVVSVWRGDGGALVQACTAGSCLGVGVRGQPQRGGGGGPRHLDVHGSEVAQEPEQRGVVGQDFGADRGDVLLAGSAQERAQELEPDTASLPVVGDDDGELGARRVGVAADEAGDAHALPRLGRDGPQCFVVAVVDLGEEAHLLGREPRRDGEEPLVRAGVAQRLIAGRQFAGVTGLDTAHQHRGPVGQRHVLPHQRGRSATGTCLVVAVVVDGRSVGGGHPPIVALAGPDHTPREFLRAVGREVRRPGRRQLGTPGVSRGSTRGSISPDSPTRYMVPW